MVAQLGGVDLQVEVTSSGTTYDVSTLMKSCDVSLSRNKVERATIRLPATTSTTNFDPMDIIQIDTRLSGEVTFDTRFYGYVREVEMGDDGDYVDLICDGESGKLALSVIPYAEYGQDYVDGGRYPLTADGNYEALYSTLSNAAGTDDPILPLTRVQMAIPIGPYGTFTPNNVAEVADGVRVHNKGAGNYSAVGQYCVFTNGRAGPNPEIWVKAKYTNESFNFPTSTLAVEIWSIHAGNLAPDEQLTDTAGNIVAQGFFEPTTSTFTWFAVTLTVQDPSMDIVAYSQKITTMHWACYIVIRAVTQHNFGWFNIAFESDSSFPDRFAWSNETNTLSQAEWTQTLSGAHTASILEVFYIDDAQFVELIPDVHYKVDPAQYRIYFYNRNDWLNQDISNMPQMLTQLRTLFMPYRDFYELNPVKVSYWKGQIDPSATLEQFAKDWISPFVTTLDVIVSTAPDITFTFFEFQNVSVLDALNKLTDWSTLTWRIYKNQAGDTVFEVRSSRVPGDWSTEYTAAQQDDRTFYAGYDVTTGTTGDPSFIKLLGIKKRRVLGNKFGKILARNSIQAGITSINNPDAGFANVVNALKVDGINSTDGAQRLQSQAVEYIESVAASVVGVDMSSAKSLLASANELVYLRDSSIAVDAAYVLKDISLKIGDGVVFDLVCEDVVSTRFKDDATKKKDGWDNAKSGVGAGTSPGGGRRDSNESVTGPRQPWKGGHNNAPTDQREETLFHEDLAITYDPSNTIWLIAIGRGTPTTPALGTEVAEVKARAVTDGTSHTLLIAEFDEYDIAAGQALGYGIFSGLLKITEMAVRFAPSEVGPSTAMKSWSVGPTGDVKWRQPYIRTGGKITVVIKIDGQ